MVYHSDGRVARAESAHERAHIYGEWGETPEAIHRAHPDGGRFVVRGMVENPLVGGLPIDPPGPVDAGTMRALLREELSTHPGFDGAIIAPILQGIVRAELAALYASLGVDPSGSVPSALPELESAPAEPEAEPQRRRGRPPGTPNRLTEQE
jgi:hypothetical protein